MTSFTAFINLSMRQSVNLSIQCTVRVLLVR